MCDLVEFCQEPHEVPRSHFENLLMIVKRRGEKKSLHIPLPINARTVPPGFPQAARGVHIVSIAAVGQERVDAMEGIGSVQMPPAAG